MTFARMKSLPIILFFTLWLSAVPGAYGEQADTEKPLKIKANRMAYDDVKQINTFFGNVRLTRGSLIMKGEKMVLRQDPSGYQYGILYAAQGGLASFRQKRDGGDDLWVEGYAERMEYDSKTEVSKLFTRAKLKRLEGTKITDEVNGNFISYESNTEIYTVSNKIEGENKPGTERIKIILPPREDKKPLPALNTNNQANSGDKDKDK
jgi:lipopolysaccharide export system protein LptA